MSCENHGHTNYQYIYLYLFSIKSNVHMRGGIKMQFTIEEHVIMNILDKWRIY